eukprot:scaffold50_cov420-Prasinococcus_capsulatus_cf.AAC.33
MKPQRSGRVRILACVTSAPLTAACEGVGLSCRCTLLSPTTPILPAETTELPEWHVCTPPGALKYVILGAPTCPAPEKQLLRASSTALQMASPGAVLGYRLHLVQSHTKPRPWRRRY